MTPTAPTTNTIDQNYFKRADEDIPTYNTRIQQYNASKNQPVQQPAQPTQTQQPTTTAAPTTDPNSPQGQLDKAKTDRETRQNEMDAAAKTFSDTVTGIQNGAIPLSPGQQAQIDGLNQQFKVLIDQQKLVNTGAQGTANIRGYQKGAAEYDANFQVKTIGSIISAGAAKVADLQIKQAAATAELTQAFKDNNIKGIKTAYDALAAAEKDHQDMLKDVITETQTAIKDANAEIVRQQEVQIKKEEDLQEEKNGILEALDKSGNAVSPEIYEAVRNAKSASDAYIAAGHLMYSENDKLDAQYKRAQIQKIAHDIEMDGKLLGGDSSLALAYAGEYAATGKIPTGLPKGTFGQIAQIAKEMPKSPGQILNNSTGVSPAGDAALQSALGALYSATKLAEQLKELDAQRYHGIVSGTLGKVFGSEEQQKYIDLRDQISDLLARARSGAALNKEEERKYAAMLPGRFAEPLGLGVEPQLRIDNFINALSGDAKNKASAQGWAINGLTKVKIGEEEFTVGDIITNSFGQKGRVNPDGSITLQE